MFTKFKHNKPATFADDTPSLPVHEDWSNYCISDTKNLFRYIIWRMAAKMENNSESDKSAHITFSLNLSNCPPVSIKITT